jgi:hypothetical protein
MWKPSESVLYLMIMLRKTSTARTYCEEAYGFGAAYTLYV